LVPGPSPTKRIPGRKKKKGGGGKFHPMTVERGAGFNGIRGEVKKKASILRKKKGRGSFSHKTNP